MGGGGYDPKGTVHGTSTDKPNFIIKFFSMKGSIRRIRRQGTDREKMFARDI